MEEKSNKQWEFDAPQYFDFLNPHLHDEEFNDSWFDRHTEDDDFLEKDMGTKSLKGPQRVLKKEMASVPADADEADMMNKPTKPLRSGKVAGMPSRVLVKTEKPIHPNSGRSTYPSPKKRQRLSDDKAMSTPDLTAAQQAEECNPPDADTDSPATNTRSQTKSLQSSPVQHQSSCDRSHLKRMKSQETLHGPMKATLPKSQMKIGSSPRKPIKLQVKRNSPCLATSLSTGNLFKPKSEEHKSLVNSAKTKNISEQQAKSSNTKGISTEELELQQIASMKKEVQKKRKLVEESYKKSKATAGYIPARSVQPATKPQGFHFSTDGRLKNPDGSANDFKVKDFTKTLREALPAMPLPSKPQVRGLTRAQPFKLTNTKSTSALPQAQPQQYESVAERVIAFHRRTPERFRTKPGGEKGRSRSATKSSDSSKRPKSKSPSLTVAKTPTLKTRGRSRPVHILSRAEQEEMEYKEHLKQQYKAHPLNKRILSVPNLGVHPVPSKPPTVAKEFHLHKTSSSVDLQCAAQEEEKFTFHAKPVNPKVLEGTLGIKPREVLPVTVAESPAFALKNRLRMPVVAPQHEEKKPAVKVNPVPYSGVPFRPRLEHHSTVPEPFTVEERSKQMLTHRQQKIQQYLEEEKKAREFHAQRIPSDSPDELPPKRNRPVTKPEPFHLEGHEKSARYKEEFLAKQVQEEEREAREAARFKARSAEVIYKDPFQPVKSSKPLTDISDFSLNTDARAVQRENFDQHLKAREAELEAIKRQREERMEQEEQALVAKMRQEAVHKATGIKKYKNVIVHPSEKPVTVPQSPKFSERLCITHSTDL